MVGGPGGGSDIARHYGSIVLSAAVGAAGVESRAQGVGTLDSEHLAPHWAAVSSPPLPGPESITGGSVNDTTFREALGPVVCPAGRGAGGACTGGSEGGRDAGASGSGGAGVGRPVTEPAG